MSSSRAWLVLVLASCASAPPSKIAPDVSVARPVPPSADSPWSSRAASTSPSAVSNGPVAAPLAGSSAPAASAPEGSTHEGRLIELMLREVEVARGLKALRPVPARFLTRPQLIARIREHVARELPPEAIRNEGLSLQLFGFLPTKFDYEAAEYQLLEDQLAGYYEPSDGTMYMARDLQDDEATATLAHELVHALQDQHWDLETRSKYEPGKGDRAACVSALAEGDATSAMFDVMITRAAPGSGKTAADLPDGAFVAQIRAGIERGAAATVPHVMRSSLAAPYIYGTLFVNALRRAGGWAAVDAAWENPPVTTEQVLHVSKWKLHEPAVQVNAPTFATLGAGWHIADEDSEGELGARIAFEEWLEPSAAAAASEGWGGDRSVLVTDGQSSALAWRLRYDQRRGNESRARQIFVTLMAGLETAFGQLDEKKGGFACRERADRGPMAIAHAGDDLIFALGPARTTGRSWSGAGNCALSAQWVHEILSKP